MTTHLNRRQALALGAGALAAASAMSTTRAFAQSTTLRIGHVLGPTHQFHTGLEQAAASVAEATAQRVELQVFPAAQLGSERDMNVAIRTGGIDMVLASPGGASVHLNELAILDAPYLFRDNAHWQNVVYGEIGQDWSQRILDNSGVRIVGWFHRGTRHVVSRNTPYDTIGKMAGQKIRVADLPPYPQVFQAFGAVPTPIAFSEMYQALESGVVDGADAPLDTVLAQKLNEVITYVNLIAWSFAAPGPILMSDASWSQLSSEDQEALVASIREASDFVTSVFTDDEAKVMEELTAAGVQFVTPSDPEAWEAAAAAAIPALAETWGGDAALYDLIRNQS
jgi:tripartite ATP-independent transporter DctP family solute receptor